jgi:ribonuclease BN (tRNA processing enzyme)
MPRPGSACSSYLVQTHAAAVVLDLGSGAFAKLELALEYTSVDAIVVSHLHADHFFDLVPFRYALKYGHLPFGERVALWLPPGGRDALEALRKAVSPDAPADFFDGVFRVREYDPRKSLDIKDTQLRFQRTKHYIDAYAVRVDRDGKSVTYSADTAPCDSVVEHARGSSIFLCEAALGLHTEEGERGHSSAEEAGEMAHRAGVGRLVLTHYRAAYSPEALVAAAKRHFSGPVEAATDGLALAC